MIQCWKKIKNFKKNNRGSFIDFFYFLGLDIVKCPQCDFILNVETYQCELLQIELINDKNTISELVEEYFALKYEEEKYAKAKDVEQLLISMKFPEKFDKQMTFKASLKIFHIIVDVFA